MKCPPCLGTGQGVGPNGTCPLCGGRGTLPDDPFLIEKCRFCLGTGQGTGKFGLCPVCKGYGRLRANLETPDPDAPFVFFVEAGQPRTAHLGLAELFKDVKGEIRVCDPYYGTGSLLRLDLLRHCSPIMFLTKNPQRNERHLLPRALQEWRREHGAIEFRESVNSDLHDRYVLSGTELIILGHGLKDVGNKESFVVRIPISLAQDMVIAVRVSFDQKWANGNLIV